MISYRLMNYSDIFSNKSGGGKVNKLMKGVEKIIIHLCGISTPIHPNN
jgi:hypothetical protein